ncbi:thiol-disulfide oxidoreductase ResA [Peribacillus cavernae]|uniref:Thiol-disulfide oxidoreductase ResA n=1 Tax=Peribacillus cavernae TaxID=1674310 RepID=A0A433HLL2_9BACI|nr:thiol-disulfide oxidoreductase ResA [Peribacillus cavernae]MDQ0219034.1 peroxiredoxin [Peribacillus cavernae]RUQ29260.1 thiol-disulfide oxidoreductase ResA [Peribacillus cavernae]
MEKKKRRLIVRTIILLILGAALVYTLYANFTKDKHESVQKGSVAPDFVLTDMEGKKHQLSDYKGQGVFLNFWGTWCKPCEREMPYIDNQYNKYKDKGVQVLAVNVAESEYSVQNFIDRHKLSFPVVIDKDQQVMTAYGIDPLPYTFLIDKEGKVVDMFKGELTEEIVRNHMESIKP